jgi:DNA-binding CsgD family transcriptional regulator
MEMVEKTGDAISEELWIQLARTFRLEPVQADVMRCFRAGMTEKETAVALGISKHAVHHHARLLYAKVAVPNRTKLLVRIEFELYSLRCRANPPDEVPRRGAFSGDCGESQPC